MTGLLITRLYAGHGTNVTFGNDATPSILTRYIVSFIGDNLRCSSALAHSAHLGGILTYHALTNMPHF